jgi:hypothetical protein
MKNVFLSRVGAPIILQEMLLALLPTSLAYCCRSERQDAGSTPLLMALPPWDICRP